MKALSYNIRGLGSQAKQRDVGDLIRREKIDLCFIQETKLESFSLSLCNSWWGADKCEATFRNSTGRSGGILSIWNKERFAASSWWDFPGGVAVNGQWVTGNIPCCFVNIYAPMTVSEKANLWGVISMIGEHNCDLCVCILGDFNAIRKQNERVGRGDSFCATDTRNFDMFIRRCDLTEIRLQGRKFTWYKPNGERESKLDRFFVNSRWLSEWPSSHGQGLQRMIYDHCPILLSTKNVDWGPKSFRFINAWTSHPEFLKLVEKVWREGSFTCWSCYIFKEKLKKLKVALKEWNRVSFGNIDHAIISLKDELQALDALDDTFGLEDSEIIKRNEIQANIFVQ
ncbi:uncharacterized protein LOC131025829 [Salvia miltiorrhiza]|uniref:uncharacterized protein LOC131025829 n=1 Tax=Salvia miltiorrhiza TaxID=226208 RepID=UPI0025AC4F35|nr:uncharacterized protein LOC131025829 [Salvia miltiorrhiza]